ncbi:MAG: VPS4-associated protein 1 [Benniella sp.]|nr:MAG: VPS4-associated protein 1 [Benniella sp.]
MSAPLRNAYVEKTATTERSCYICMKMTVKVLTAKDGGDFFYVCASHLSDPGFAQGEGYPSVPTPEALAAVAAIRKKKAEAEKKKQEETTAAKTSTDDSQKSAASKFGSAVFSGLGTIASATASSVSSFINDEEAKQARIQEQEYQKRLAEAKKKPAYWVLDQKIFFLRQNEVKKKAAKKGATETLNGLSFPRVPKDI